MCIVLVVLFVDTAALTAKSTAKQTKQMQDNLINDLPEFIEGAHRGLPRLA